MKKAKKYKKQYEQEKSETLQNAEMLKKALLRHAETQLPGERVIPTLFTPQAGPNDGHNGMDAPGWCLKQARKCERLGKKAQKNYDEKRRERLKAIKLQRPPVNRRIDTE